MASVFSPTHKKQIGVFALIGSASFLLGCTFNYPTDLQIVSVQAVKQDEIPHTKPLALRDPQYPMLKITFVGDANLVAYTVDSYGISASAHFCNASDQIPSFVGSPTPDLALGNVYTGSLNIDDSLYNSGLMYNQAKSDVLVPHPVEAPSPLRGNLYSVYIFTYRTPPPIGTWSHPEQSWDLIRSPHDVCLRVGVLKDYLMPRRSNQLKISAAQISSALHSPQDLVGANFPQ